MIQSIDDFKNPFFIGIAGAGMSAIAQYLQGVGKSVHGSDRYFETGEALDIKEKLEKEGIRCFLQNGEGITGKTDLVVCSTAIEDTVPELQKAKEMNIPVIRRSALLAIIANSKKTIAVGGTSGKSTTCAMLFNILETAGLQPSIISGAGLVSIIKEGKIGNAKVGTGEWLVIEADESDGSIVEYKSDTGLLINVDKDHKEIETLMDLFRVFKNNCNYFMVNRSHYLARQLSVDAAQDFSTDANITAGVVATGFKAEGFQISFTVRNVHFTVHALGRHTMENATAAIAAALHCGADLTHCKTALAKYEGIYRRHQVIGQKKGIWLIDDYAHNPVKCAASIAACQPLSEKIIAWFQPHGYGPTKFLRKDFTQEIGNVLRENDEIWMSEIFYAGGTAEKDISSNDLIEDIRAMGKKAYFVADRTLFLEAVRPHLAENNVLLLMGARDPGLEEFAKKIWEKI
jgi:UDP-N-acetylmuramate--alanine ligase